MKNKKGESTATVFIGIFMVLAIIGLVVGLTSFDTVDASHKGVKVKLGKITGTMDPGMQYTGMLTQVYQYNLRVRKMAVTMAGDQGAVDKDGQSVFATIEINYKLNALNVENAYAKIGQDEFLADTLRLEGIIKEGFKTVTSQYSSLEIFQKRQEVKDAAIKQIQSRFPKEYFSIENVIISNIDFNPAFKAAIEQGKVAEEMAKAKSKEVEVNKYEADKKIETARGEAESKKLQASAQAFEIKVMAEAEAKALELKAAKITPLMVENNRIDKWNGEYPQYYMPGAGMGLLMQMPNNNGAVINGS